MTVHIGLNLIFVVPGATGGIETYAREIVPLLRDSAPGVRFTAFVCDQGRSLFEDELPTVSLPVRPRGRFGWIPGEQTLLPRLVRREGCNLLHSLASTGPATGPFRRITTIHDLIYRKLPREHAGIRFFGARYLVSRGLIPLAARRSNRIIVTSKIVAEDLQAHLRISPDKIDVCPLGPGRPGRRTPTEERELRERYALADRRIALCLSPVWPHKNVVRLPEAMSLIPPPCRPLLIISGRATRYSPALIEAARRYGVESDLRITDWVTPEDLDGLYALADCVVVPSLYEGFGFPVLEAMSRGVPVACSSGGALPEVGGDAALYFDPRSSAEIAEAMLRILSNPRDAERLRAAGQRRAADFSWQRAAQATLRSYERTLGHRLTEDAV